MGATRRFRTLHLTLTTGKDNKQLTKVIKKESKIEKAALTVAIKELTELQSLQKAAVRVSKCVLLLAGMQY